MKHEIICGIYKITSPSKKVYIGQSINCLHRLTQYRLGRCNKQPKLLASILKYGWNNHIYEIIHRCEEKELNDFEKYYAELYNVYEKESGLNIRECGGSRGRHSQESIEKCRVSKVGKKKSPEHLAKIVATRKKMYEAGTLVPWNKGLKGAQIVSEETNQKKREKMLGQKRSEQHREKGRMRWKREKESQYYNTDEAKKERSTRFGRNGGLHPLAKKVLNTEIGIFYDSAKEVSKTYNIKYQKLVRYLNGYSRNRTQFIYV